MTSALLIACGAAVTIGALVAGGEVVRFFFAPGRGDEALPRAVLAGDIVLGRIRSAAPSLGGAFVDIGAGEDAFRLARPSAQSPHEGAMEILRVQRPALAGKSAILAADWKSGLSPQRIEALSAAAGPPRLLSHAFDAAFVVARLAQDLPKSDILVDQPDGARALAAEGVAAACDAGRVHAIDVEQALETALGAAVAIGGGARMIVEETAGGCVVDVDAGAAANAARKPNDRVNERAAQVIFRELSRRSVGGRVIVDFLPPSSGKARRYLLDVLEARDRELYDRRAGKLAPDGLFDMTAPRRDASLLERSSQSAGTEFLRAGRQATPDWAAKRAIAALEARLRRHPRLRLSLEAGDDIARQLEARPQWLSRLAERYGARARLSVTARPARSFDVREI